MPTPINILIVEDSINDAELLVAELRRAGFAPLWTRVETESDFLAEITKLPDIILSDYSMPQFNGLRAVEILREGGWDIPFVLISGTVGEEMAVEAMKHGATDYLLKDRITRLGNAVARALEQKRLQVERKQAQETLRESEEKFRQLAENINEVFWITDSAKNQMLYISPAYEKIWGRTCESLYQSPRTWLESIHPEDRQRVMESASTKQITGEYDEIYRVLRPDGSLRWIQDRAFPLRDGAGEVYRLVGTATDITKNRKLEEQLLQSQKMEAIGQLAGGVAHDFNNILAVIQLQAGMLRAEQNLQPGQMDFAREIEKAAERAADLTRQLLLFSRRQAMQPRDLDLNDIITNISKMVQRILGEDIQMQVKYAKQPLFIHADAGMMEQVLMNLTVNARDALQGNGHLIIETSAAEFDAPTAASLPQARLGSFVCLSVSDTGCGIPPDVLPRIFEPFFTTKEVGKGTGLGLATVFGIVQQHLGWINVYSEVGRGTTFRVYLPRLARAADGHPTSPTVASVRGGNETILLVEDDLSLRNTLRNALTHLGYRVLEASSGVHALEVWRQNHRDIHLLLTDIVMPEGMKGHELAGQLLREKSDLKVIYMSGYAADNTANTASLKEGVNFLIKPFEAHTLALTLRSCLDSAKIL